MRNKTLFLIIISQLLILDLVAQKTSEKDSLLNVVNTAKEKIDRASAYQRLTWLNLLNDISLSKKYLDSAFTLYSELKDKNGLASCYYKQAVICRLEGNYKKGLEHIAFSINHETEAKDTIGLANCLYQKAVLNSLKGDFDDALEDYLTILSIYEDLNYSKEIGVTLNSIGIIYRELEMYPEAISSYKKAIEIHQKMEDLVNLPNAYSNLALVYSMQQEYDLALEYYGKTQEINIETNNIWGQGINNENVGSVLAEQDKYKEAIDYFINAKTIFEKNNFRTELARVLSNLGLLYFQIEDYNKSKYYLKEAERYSTSSKIVNRDIYKNLFLLYKKEGNYKLALSNYEKFHVFKDSIFEDNRIKNINELDKKYQTEKKDKEIATQQLELKEKETEIQKEKTQNNYMLGAIVFLATATILLVFLFKQRQKRKNQELLTLKREFQIKTLESLIEGEEKERHRVAKELHDGVNGDLAAIKYKLSSLLEMNNNVIKEAITMIDDSCKQVRAISHNLIPPSLENFNLLEATQEYCSNLNEVTQNLEITFQHLGETIEMPKKAEVNVFRIVQELVTNAIRHAEASQIDVQISCRDNTIQITVEDDGKGFDKNNVKSDGIGLSNVQSRVDYLNATTDFISNNQGTSYTIDIDKDTVNGN